jgi:hypothetical protein
MIPAPPGHFDVTLLETRRLATRGPRARSSTPDCLQGARLFQSRNHVAYR